jgi:glutaredoxin
MDFFLFTYPNCQKCEKLKQSLKDAAVSVREHNLAERESKLKIREFLSQVRRDAGGAIILPMLVAQEGGSISAVLNSREEFEAWWKSRA